MKDDSLLARAVLRNPTFFIFVGIVLAVLVARSYVALGGNLNYKIGGIVIHHFFIGIVIVLVSGLIFFPFYKSLSRHYKGMNLMAMLFGFGTGLIIDEANFLISTGETYSLIKYYSVYNTLVEITVLVAVAAIFLVGLVRSRPK